MNRQRIFGEDKPFMAWLRRQEEDLASSENVGFVQTDVDTFIHRYMMPIDSVGTREVQCLMLLEVKTRNGVVSESQLDTLAKIHACSLTKRNVNYRGQLIRHFGVGFVFLSGTDPDDSSQIGWGRFTDPKAKRGCPFRRRITKDQLVKLLRFELHPDSLEPCPLRRRHKTARIVEVVKAPLGFEYEETVVKRS